MERYVTMPSVDKSNCKACVASHGAMNSTLSKKSAVHIVRCIARNSSDHVCRICHIM